MGEQQGFEGSSRKTTESPSPAARPRSAKHPAVLRRAIPLTRGGAQRAGCGLSAQRRGAGHTGVPSPAEHTVRLRPTYRDAWHTRRRAVTAPAGSFGLALAQRQPPDPSSRFLCTKHNSGPNASSSDTNRLSPRRREAVAANPRRRAQLHPYLPRCRGLGPDANTEGKWVLGQC